MNAPQSQRRGRLFLLPVALGKAEWNHFLPAQVQATAARLDCFVVENARNARAHLKQLDYPRPLREVQMTELPDKPAALDQAACDALLAPALAGRDLGLMADAGCPAVADPGAALVARAHDLGIQVVPLVGPSSILLGLMASGLNGQSFSFHGYLPIRDKEREQALHALETESRKLGRTQIFIETPYRNEAMFDALLRTLKPATRLCIACDLNTATEMIRTLSISKWRSAARPRLARRPCLFLFLA